MRRYTLRILLCLILGVVTTIAIAWGSILWAPWSVTSRPWNDPYDRIEDDQPWPEPANPDWPHPSGVGHISGFWVTMVSASAFHDDSTTDILHQQIVQQIVWKSGLPSRSMKRVVIQDVQGHRVPSDWREGVLIPDWLSWMSVHQKRLSLLPLIPIWPGFLIDTLFYGTIWLGVFLGFGATLRAIRRKRGRCPVCTYDLRGGSGGGCPECGWDRTDTQDS